MFNFSIKKIGGIRFVQIGRLNFSFSVTSLEKFVERQALAACAEALEL